MGFRSPLSVLGLSGPQVTIQGGYRTPLPTFNAGGTAAVTQGGYRTPLPPFQAGGFSGVIQGGFRTPLPFFFGGGGVGEDPETQVLGGGRRKRRSRRRLIRRLVSLQEQQKPIHVLPDSISGVVSDIVKDGKAEIEGLTVKIDNAPIPPEPTISTSAPSLDEIKSKIDRELAELIRAQEFERFAIQVADFREQIMAFEEEFLVFLILTMD